MPSQALMPQPTIPVRSEVQRTFVDKEILAGFTDDNHFLSIVGEYFLTLKEEEKQSLINSVHEAQTYVRTLPPFVPNNIEIRPFQNEYTDKLSSAPEFINAFRNSQYHFSYINPKSLVALQAQVWPRHDPIPSDENTLIEFALPNQWDIPVEINFIPPLGPIQMLSSSPMLQSLTVELDNVNGKILIGAPKHLNLIQVVHFQDKFFLRNGYHRVVDSIQAGVQELPCIIIESVQPEGVLIPGLNFFNFGYVMSIPRPPLVSDFLTQAAIMTKVRERRYGMLVKLNIDPLAVGI